MPRDRLLELQQRTGTIVPASSTGGGGDSSSAPAAVVPVAAPAVSATPAASTPTDAAASRDVEAGGSVAIKIPRSSFMNRLLHPRRASAAAPASPTPPPTAASDAFLSSLGELTSQLAEVRSDVEEISKQQCRQLNSPRHQQDAWQRTQDLSTSTLSRLSRLRRQLDAQQAKLKAGAGELTSTQAQMIQIQINSARTQLLAVVQKFNEEEVNFRERKRDHLKRQLQITGSSLDEEELESLLDAGDPQVFNESILARVDQARTQLTDAEDRYEQIRSLETSIEQLHEMFQQLSLLVQSQGELVTRIEDTTVAAAANAEQGQKQLASAQKKKVKSRKMAIGCGVVSAVLLLILLIILISYLG